MRKTKKQILIFTALAILIFGAGIAVFVFRPHQVGHSTAGQYTKGEGADNISNGSVNSQVNGAEPGDQKSTTGGGSATAPIAPTGNFVSAHHAGLLTEIASACNTTPGAICTITFSNGEATIGLPGQRTDRGGATYWNAWTPQSIGLRPGSWTIRATAQMNGQSMSSSDAMSLDVMQ